MKLGYEDDLLSKMFQKSISITDQSFKYLTWYQMPSHSSIQKPTIKGKPRCAFQNACLIREYPEGPKHLYIEKRSETSMCFQSNRRQICKQLSWMLNGSCAERQMDLKYSID